MKKKRILLEFAFLASCKIPSHVCSTVYSFREERKR